jgi:hypothetical protein
VKDDYEVWKAMYRARHALEAAPWPDFAFDDAAFYRAFASDDGVDAELVFGKPSPVGAEQRTRDRELIEFCARRLPDMPVGDCQDGFAPVVLEVQRLTPDRSHFKLAWDGAPPTAPSTTPAELHRRAMDDVRRRLGIGSL